jgi:hypothetical protein
MKTIKTNSQGEGELSSLCGLFQRQLQLETLLMGKANTVLPSLLFSVGCGHLRHLEQLVLYDIRILFPSVAAFAAAMSKGALPNLRMLMMDNSLEEGGVTALLQSIGGGACPRLGSLQLPFPSSYQPVVFTMNVIFSRNWVRPF